MYVFFFPLLSSLQSKAAKPSEEGFLRPFGSKRQSRARGGLNRRNIRLRICFFSPPLAPPRSALPLGSAKNLGGEIITPTVCITMSKSTVKPRFRSLTMQS